MQVGKEARGVGLAVCRELARAGTHVAITYHKKRDVADALVNEIQAFGRKATAHQLTIGDPERVEAVVEAAAQEYGRLHTIVVGAGTLATQVALSDMTREQWRTIIDQDLN